MAERGEKSQLCDPMVDLSYDLEGEERRAKIIRIINIIDGKG